MYRAWLLLTISSVCACAKPATPAPVQVPEHPAPREERPAEPLRLRVEVLMPGMPLSMFVELRDQPEQTGSITVPAQGSFETQLHEIQLEPELRFTVPSLQAQWVMTLAEDGASTACTFEQHGMQFDCIATVIDEAALEAAVHPPRPQTPSPPFPYERVEVSYDTDDGIHREGTLTVPEGQGPHPAVLLISGSGAQDRDSTIMKHRPFAVWADHLSRRGVAVLRVDDRGVGGTTGDLSEVTGAELAADAAAGVAFLREHEAIDPARVGLMGHSEGGSIAPRVAADDPKLAFVVMLAGPGVPGWQILEAQAKAINAASGADEAQVEQAANTQAFLMGKLREAETLEAGIAAIAPVVGEPRAKAMMTPWFLDFVRYDPQPALKRVEVPVLAVIGELDLQVPAAQNGPAIEAALSKNADVTVTVLPGLNHLLQPADTGLPQEYASIETTIDPAALELVGDWIVARAGL